MQQEKRPKVTVCVITYNHEKYISQCLQSIFDQGTDFNFEIVIGDDCSKDSTRVFVLDFLSKYPNMIIPLFHEQNIGPIANWLKVLSVARGEYIAFCEGDDYWIDRSKLKKQVEFMDANPTYSMSFHNARIEYDDGSGKPPQLFNPIEQKKILSLTDVIKKWQIASSSMLFRNDLVSLPSWYKDIYNGDYALHLLLAGKGAIGYQSEIMSVYRKHPTSFSGVVRTDSGFYQKRSIELFQHFLEYYKETNTLRQIRKKIRSLKRSIIYQKIKKKFPLLEHHLRIIRSKSIKI
jgi:glycosyltransferase involved in cell wall biosynthesis